MRISAPTPELPCYEPLLAEAIAELARVGFSPATWPGLKTYLDQGGWLRQALREE